MNLTNEHEFFEWVKTIVGAPAIMTELYRDRAFVEQNIGDIADVVIHGWIKKNILGYLEEDGFVGGFMLSPVNDMAGLPRLVLEDANAGNPPYKFDIAHVPASLIEALIVAAKTHRFSVMKNIREQLAQSEFKLDIKALRTNMPDFESTMAFAYGRSGNAVRMQDLPGHGRD